MMNKVRGGGEGFPLVSVVIPTYNTSPYLLESLESVLNQSYPNIEIIVIDDGSTDNTQELLRPYTETIIYQRRTNGGLAKARNTGHTLAQGEFVAWLDADDIAHPDRISIQASYLETHPDVSLVFSDFSTFNACEELGASYAAQYYSQIRDAGGIQNILYDKDCVDYMKNNIAGNNGQIDCYSGDGRYSLIWGNFIHPPTVMIRKTAIETAGKLAVDIPTQEDWEYFFRIAKCGPTSYLDIPLLKYRLHEQQMSSPKNRVVNAKGIVTVMERMFQQEKLFLSEHYTRYKQTISRHYLGAAYTLIEAGNKQEALSYILKAIKLVPRNYKNYKLLLKWFLPR